MVVDTDPDEGSVPTPDAVSPVQQAISASAGSMITTLFSTPLDVVKTRVMTDAGAAAVSGDAAGGGGAGDGDGAGAGGGLVSTAARIVREEGPGALFAGVAPRLVRAVVSGGVQFGSYEVAKRLTGGNDA